MGQYTLWWCAGLLQQWLIYWPVSFPQVSWLFFSFHPPSLSSFPADYFDFVVCLPCLCFLQENINFFVSLLNFGIWFLLLMNYPFHLSHLSLASEDSCSSLMFAICTSAMHSLRSVSFYMSDHFSWLFLAFFSSYWKMSVLWESHIMILFYSGEASFHIVHLHFSPAVIFSSISSFNSYSAWAFRQFWLFISSPFHISS